MDNVDKARILSDEELIIRDGGEMPEVTLFSSIYYLTEDQEGPQLDLDSADYSLLKKAVIQGYLRIILRDLMLENRDRGLYRGLERCRVNWERLSRFCSCENLCLDEARKEVAMALRLFMLKEVADVESGERASCINCTSQALESLVMSLGLTQEELPKGWQNICP